MHKNLLAVVGPTSTGKSELACHLARIFNGEIIGADSRQVYRHMDIGTAKPSPESVRQVPHHLLSIINPDESFSLAQYQAMASHAISDIQARDKLPVLVGGSGQYVWAVLEGWRIPGVSPEPEYRRHLEAVASHDMDALYQQLMSVDPEAGARIDPRNVRRVIRALEVRQNIRESSTEAPRKKMPPFKTRVIGLTGDRQELYRRIDQRVDRMVAEGLVEEVEKLLIMGYHERLPALSGIGYRQVIQHLRGEVSLPVAVQQTKSETHRYVRQQYNWFRLQDKRIQWFNIREEPETAIEELVARFLEGDTD
jgi:tRNA dimethylallyltransferase